MTNEAAFQTGPCRIGSPAEISLSAVQGIPYRCESVGIWQQGQKRARLMAVPSWRWYLALVPVMRAGTILPVSR